MRLLDLFCGRWGWSRAFAARGWECEGFDLVDPADTPSGCTFRRFDVMHLTAADIRRGGFNFACASSPCEEFSLFGMAMFHPNPKYPKNGIRLFNHAREICWESGIPFVMENVRPAQKFVGEAKDHCGPFYLWGPGVPPLLASGNQQGYEAWRLNKVWSVANRGAQEAPHARPDADGGVWVTGKTRMDFQGCHHSARVVRLCSRLCGTNLRCGSEQMTGNKRMGREQSHDPKVFRVWVADGAVRQ